MYAYIYSLTFQMHLNRLLNMQYYVYGHSVNQHYSTKGRLLILSVNYNHQLNTWIRCLVTTAVIGQCTLNEPITHHKCRHREY